MSFGPHRTSEETYLAYTRRDTRADDSFHQRSQARLVPASAGENTSV